MLHIINGPNLNLLGKRESSIYGNKTLAEIMAECQTLCQKHGVECSHFQSNHEGEIIEYIHQNIEKTQACIANLGAYTHTSIAIRDACSASKSIKDFPLIETHISNVYTREEFRHKSMIASISTAVITGFGGNSYRLSTIFAIETILGKKII
jgi:3-dehydroquinate dehydratase-2